MDWVLAFTLLIPLLPGLGVGLAARIRARDERSALLAELALAFALAVVGWVVVGPGYAVYAFIWIVLGAQIVALFSRRRRASA